MSSDATDIAVYVKPSLLYMLCLTTPSKRIRCVIILLHVSSKTKVVSHQHLLQVITSICRTHNTAKKQKTITLSNTWAQSVNFTDPVSDNFGINAPGRLEGLLGADWGAEDLRGPIIGLPPAAVDDFIFIAPTTSTQHACYPQYQYTHTCLSFTGNIFPWLPNIRSGLLWVTKGQSLEAIVLRTFASFRLRNVYENKFINIYIYIYPC